MVKQRDWLKKRWRYTFRCPTHTYKSVLFDEKEAVEVENLIKKIFTTTSNDGGWVRIPLGGDRVVTIPAGELKNSTVEESVHYSLF